MVASTESLSVLLLLSGPRQSPFGIDVHTVLVDGKLLGVELRRVDLLEAGLVDLLIRLGDGRTVFGLVRHLDEGIVPSSGTTIWSVLRSSTGFVLHNGVSVGVEQRVGVVQADVEGLHDTLDGADSVADLGSLICGRNKQQHGVSFSFLPAESSDL